MKILITGAAGFIASHVADRYLEAGHQVVVVDNLSTGRRANVPAGARLVELDIKDPGLAELVARERPEVINHHAAQIDVRRSVADPVEDIRTNVEGTVALAVAGVAAGTRRFIFASTGGAIYGDQVTFPASEDHITEPMSPYGCSKLASEKYLNTLSLNAGLEVVCLRYANVYGPRQSPHGEAGVVAIFCHRLLAGQSPTIHGDGLQTRDYVFVEDVARANVMALATARTGIYNIGTGVETTVVELYRRLAGLCGHERPAIHGPGKPGEQRRSVIGCSRAEQALGWRPQVDIETGLAATLEFFKVVSR